MNDNEFSTKKLQLSSASLANVFSIDNDWVINGIFNLYEVLLNETDVTKGKNYTRHIDDLYNEWLLDYHANSEHIDITKLGNMIDLLINKFDLNEIDTYKLLFAMETYFIMILKLLVANFVEHFKNKHDVPDKLSWSYITALFWNDFYDFDSYLKDFLEVSYYEWFVSSKRNNTSKIHDVLIDIWVNINLIDISQTINIENLYGLFNGLYCELFEYRDFNTYKINDSNQYSSNSLPDFCSLIVYKAVNLLIHILKRDNAHIDGSKPVPSYINSYNLSETRLSKINIKILTVRTSVGDFQIPKLDSFEHMELFIDQLHDSISSLKSFDSFWKIIQKNNNYDFNVKAVSSVLYENLMILRTTIQYDFWTISIKHRVLPFLF